MEDSGERREVKVTRGKKRAEGREEKKKRRYMRRGEVNQEGEMRREQWEMNIKQL